MKHLENFNHWYDPILNSFPFCLDDSKIKTTGLAWLFKEQGKWNFTPRITSNEAQYYNAIFFIRTNLSALLLGVFMFFIWPVLSWYLWALVFFLLMLITAFGQPFALFFMIRWAATGRRQFIQTGIGWKQTGRFAIHRRIQSDASSAIGYHADLPNTDHVTGFDYGKH